MYCPMLINSYGDSKFCNGDKCAWWDETQRQCAVKSFLMTRAEPNIYDIVSKINTGITVDFGDEE